MSGPLQYEDTLLVSAADSDLSDSPMQNRAPTLGTPRDEPPALMPPFDAQLAILTTMLAHRSDAAALIAATADRLGVFPLTEPGPVMQSEPTATFLIRLPELERSLLCEAFDDWRAEIAGRRHRAALVAAHRAKCTLSPRQPGPTVASLASTPELTRVVNWA